MTNKKWDFEPDKKILTKLNALEKEIEKLIGKPCKKKANTCYTCRVWTAFDNLKLQFY